VTTHRAASAATRLAAVALVAGIVGACDAGSAPPTPPISPGTDAAPREVNVIAKDWLFLPDPVDVSPGETVLLHLVNGGLEIHEFIIGDAEVQDAWETAEALVAQHPPGPTPIVSVPPAVAGLRVVVPSGQRIDVRWTVPAARQPPLVIGCHIPGHWAKGMVVPVRFVQAASVP
jgi:uncharacterized cupredoxin-like copper-binding protein